MVDVAAATALGGAVAMYSASTGPRVRVCVLQIVGWCNKALVEEEDSEEVDESERGSASSGVASCCGRCDSLVDDGMLGV